MADPKRVEGGNGNLGSIQDILTLFGNNGNKQTSSSDTGALRGILGNLQGTNYEDVLKSIFTQAGGQIPGLTAGMSNAIGARTGGNSAVQTALGKLLESTVMKAAGQTATLNQGNQALQIQAANAIANGNSTKTTKSGSDNAAKILAGLQLGGKFLDSKVGKEVATKGKGLFDSVFNQGESPVVDSSGTNMFAGEVGNFSGGGSDGFSIDGGTNLFADAFTDYSVSDGIAGGFDSAGDSAIDWGSIGGDLGGGGDIPVEEFIDLGDFFADGGLVGRDNKEEDIKYPMGGKTRGPSAQAGSPAAYADGGRVEPKVGTKGPEKKGGTGGGLSKEATQATVAKPAETAPKITLTIEPGTFQPSDRKGTVPRVEKAVANATGEKYADGGTVRSGGGRASSQVRYATDPIARTDAVNAPRAGLNRVRDPNTDFEFGPLDLNAQGEANAVSQESIDSIDPSESVTVGETLGGIVGHAVMGLAAPGLATTMNALGIPGAPTGIVGQAINALSEAFGFNSQANSQAAANAAAISQADAQESVSSEGTAGIGNTADGGTASANADGSPSGGSGNSGGDDGADGGADGFASGGKIKGPGTGTSDSILARVSNGEYIISKDVVDKMGVDFFDNLQAQFHTPVGSRK